MSDEKQPAPTIPGIKLIKANSYRVDNPDDSTYPFRLDATFSPPQFMEVAFIALCGPQEILRVRGMTREALEQFVEVNNFKTHPRLLSLTITEPEKEAKLAAEKQVEKTTQQLGQLGERTKLALRPPSIFDCGGPYNS